MSHDSIVHLIDDDEDVRKALAFLLSTAGHAVRVYESASTFLEHLGELRSGCIVSDVRMPGIDGLQLQRLLNEKSVKLPVIIMTGHADVGLAVQVMKEGAVDFLEKPFSDDILLTAIDGALNRHTTSRRHDDEVAGIVARLATLSERERQVLDGLVTGHPNKTIAFDLKLSPRTVEVHRANVMLKMGAGSLSELVRMAMLAKLR